LTENYFLAADFISLWLQSVLKLCQKYQPCIVKTRSSLCQWNFICFTPAIYAVIFLVLHYPNSQHFVW